MFEQYAHSLSGYSCYLTLVAGKTLSPWDSAPPLTLSQALSVQSAPSGPCAAPSDVQLRCSYCRNSFCSKPEILEWEASAVRCGGARRGDRRPVGWPQRFTRDTRGL